MEVMEAIYARRAVRQFTPDSVDDQSLRHLIDAAVHAPSAVNQQPWSFFIVQDKTLLARISREAKPHMLKNSMVGLVSHHFEELLSDPRFDIFYTAPTLIVIASVADGPWAVADCALAAENLMLAARALELGTCWIGFAQAWLNTTDGKAALGMPSSYVPVAAVIVGHPKSFPPPVTRREPELHWIRS